MRRIITLDEATLPASPDVVLRIALDMDRYAEWWPRPARFEPLTPPPTKAGSRFRVRRGLLSWVVTITSVEADRILMTYSDGAWDGEARWVVRPVIEGAALVYRIELDPRPWWLKLLLPALDVRRRHSRDMIRVFMAFERRVRELGLALPEPTAAPSSAEQPPAARAASRSGAPGKAG